MYKALIARMRYHIQKANFMGLKEAESTLLLGEAADAIEELTDRNVGKWINYLEDGFVECPFCKSATNCDGDIAELHYCFNCGAKLEGDEDV